jgi:hypothetical protein
MRAIEYRGFNLSPRPYQFQDTGEWIVRVIITKRDEGCSEIREKQFFSANTFNKKSDADHNAIQFGKEVIDGIHANLSVGTL